MIKIETRDSKVITTTPYDKNFIQAAKSLGGKWQAPNWVFDRRDEERVREVCREIYGTDGTDGPGVTLRVTFEPHHSVWRDAIRIAGREVARATSRDSGAKLGEGVVLLSGGFASAGSVKNWGTESKSDGATVLIRDMPIVAAQRIIEEHPAGVQAAQLEDEAPVSDKDALREERARLLARLAEIDAALAEE